MSVLKRRFKNFFSTMIISLAVVLCPSVQAEWPNDMSIKRTHPVLNFFDPTELDPNKLKAVNFKQMNGLYHDVHMMNFLRDDMRAGEEKALQSDKLGSILRNCSQAEVVALIGKPEIITGPIAGWKDSSADQQNWFYYMGYCSIAVRVAFVRDRCVLAKGCYKEQRRDFENAAFESIQKYSLGKNEAEISSYLPAPLKSDKGMKLEILDGVRKWIPVNSKATRIFTAGSDFYLDFHFQDGLCDEVTKTVLFH